MMDQTLMKILVFITALQIINTVINVIHKLEKIHGPPAHVAIAILSMIILFGYSGILNSLFLKRKFSIGRICYIVIAILSQCIILALAILAWVKTITYYLAIAIIHGIMGFIVAINFICAVAVVHEQHLDLIEAKNEKKRDKYRQALKLLSRYHDKNRNRESVMLRVKSEPGFEAATASEESYEKMERELQELTESLLSEEEEVE